MYKAILSTIIISWFMVFTNTASGQTEKKTYILIHGSWHSAWNWYKITPLLEGKGHMVYAPDLPGMGRDKTPIEEVTLKLKVEKISQLIDEIPGKVILVGHSKNGAVISQMAEYRQEKIEKLIYIAAVLIENGKSVHDYFKLDVEGLLGPYVIFDEKTQSSTLDPRIYKEGLYHDCDDDITDMAKVLLSAEARESSRAILTLTDKNFGSIPKYYIECTEDRAVTPFLQKKMYTDMPVEKVYSMATSHSPFFSKPKELTDIY